MTAHNTAMSFWPLERQLIDGTTPSDQDCREMCEEARRMSNEIADLRRQLQFLTSTTEAIAHIRAGVRSRIHDFAASNAMGNVAHTDMTSRNWVQIADAERAERREWE